MRLPPPEVVATWPPPNYVDPETRGVALMVVEVTILPVAASILALRLYVRVVMLRIAGWDDWLMVGASAFGAGVTICVLLASSLFGWSKHIWDLLPSDLPPSRQVSMAAQALFVMATSLAKLSILLSYLRFAPANSRFRRLTYAAAIALVVINTGFLIFLFAQCTPTASYWSPTRANIDCLPEGPGLIAQAVSTVLFDFVVWLLPLRTLARTRLPRAQRIALILLFSAGLFVVFAACMRTYWIWYVVEGTYDVTWEGFYLWIWTAVEVHLGVICGCIPCLKPLVKGFKHGGGDGSKAVNPVYSRKAPVHVVGSRGHEREGSGGVGSTVEVLGGGESGTVLVAMGGRASGDEGGAGRMHKMDRWSSSGGSDVMGREGRRQDV